MYEIKSVQTTEGCIYYCLVSTVPHTFTTEYFIKTYNDVVLEGYKFDWLGWKSTFVTDRAATQKIKKEQLEDIETFLLKKKLHLAMGQYPENSLIFHRYKQLKKFASPINKLLGFIGL